MSKAIASITTGFFIFALAFNTIAETKVTGFASMIGGVVTNGEQFLSDYPNVGLYDKDLSFTPDTTIGVQLKTKLDDEFEFIVQLLSRGASEFQSDIDWAYINYKINSEFSLQAGRKRLPLYYYSDFYELGYAYYWIRPPSDSYTWQITNFNGISLSYEPDFGDYDVLLNVYIGREDDMENKLLSFLRTVPTDETWKNMIGFVAEISDDIFEYRFTVMSSELDRESNSIILAKDVPQLFYGLSVNARYNNYIFLSEYNHYQRDTDKVSTPTSMLSFGYKINKSTPHITWSELKQKDNQTGNREHHYTYSLGLRHDLKKSVALKIQYDKTFDKGTTSSKVLGNGELLSFGIDIVF